MSKKISSVHVEMSADSAKLEAGLKKAKGGLTQFGNSANKATTPLAKISGAMASIASIAAPLAAAGFAAKKAFEWGKEGASLEYAEKKFTNLSRSIGAVSDALLGDLRTATRGLVSDAQLVQSAGDFMALGLAKSRDEVVRLTTVAGALGMDMNQLVLTLTNQTTMRFDALGVSVAGFDDRVKALRATGMSASEAFNEAFLRQAEEQIELVGEAADSSAGEFARMDAAVANMSNTLKRKGAPAVTAFAGLVADMLTLEPDDWFRDGSDAAADFINTLFKLDKVEFDVNKSLRSSKKEAKEMAAIYSGDLKPAVTSLEATLRSASGAYNEQSQIMSGYTTDTFKLARQMDDLREAISGNMDDAQKDFIKNTEDLRIKTVKLKDQIEILEGKEYLTKDQEAELAGLRSELDETETAIGDLAVAHEEATRRILYGMLEQKLAANGLTTAEGDLLEGLAKKWGLIDDATLSAQQATTEATGIMESNVANATERVNLFYEAWNALNSLGQVKDFMIRVALETQERVAAWGGDTNPYAPKKTTTTTSPKGPPQAAGGFVSAGVTYPVGEHGIEMFTPATNGYITPNHALAGGDMTVIQNFYTLPGQSPQAIAAHATNNLANIARRNRAGAGYAGV